MGEGEDTHQVYERRYVTSENGSVTIARNYSFGLYASSAEAGSAELTPCRAYLLDVTGDGLYSSAR